MSGGSDIIGSATSETTSGTGYSAAGLPQILSRDDLIEALGRLLALAQEPRAFLIVGINDLAVTNDLFGFDIGDELIAGVERLIAAQLTADDLIGRVASNKFGIVLRAGDSHAMRETAERVLKAVYETRIETSECRLAASISIGGILLPEHAQTPEDAILRGLRALSAAKETREGFVAYQPCSIQDEQRRQNIRIAKDVASALEAGRMRLALQPIVSTTTWEPAFYEALLRMELPNGELVPAGRFVSIAEQLGFVRFLDRRGLELAAELLEQEPDLQLTLNVSGLTCSDPGWLAALRHLARNSRLATRLMVEITETAAIHDLHQFRTFVDALKELGCRVAIDDFGAGYTSFRTLKGIAIDMVKIDGAFVLNLLRDSSDRFFIRAMVELAGSLGMETVAEWVGNEETALLLAEDGVDYLQGFHFGQPAIVAKPNDPGSAFTSETF